MSIKAGKGYYLDSWAGSATADIGIPSASNLAKAFTPTKPMCAPGTDTEKLEVLLDVPKPLQQAINAGMQKIGYECLRENAKVVLKVYEGICTQHVLENQIQDRALRKILRRDPNLELKDPDNAKVLAPKSRIAKSSLLGQDPYGDKPLPHINAGEAKTSDKEEDEDTGAGEDDSGKYSNAELLLVEIQDKNYAYLTTHLRRILAAPLYVRVKTEEIKYASNEGGIRDQTARKRMPWSEYKRIVLELLPVEYCSIL